MALLNAYPLPTPGYQQGSINAIFNSENPQDQRKDNIRFDYRFNNSNQLTFRYSKYNWVAIDAFRGTFPLARTDWNRPNSTQTLSWTSTIRNNLINEPTYAHSLDQVFINVFTGTELYKRSRPASTTRTSSRRTKKFRTRFRPSRLRTSQKSTAGPIPSSSQGPIHTFSDAATLVKGRHTFKAGAVLEYSGEDDFDQINVQAIPGSTNNQNGRFEFLDNRAGGTGLAVANAAMGLFSNYAEIGQRAFTKWRALATDVFVQDSWKPASNLTIEGGIRWAIWPPWHSQTNNIANFEPQFYDKATAAIIDPDDGTDYRRQPLQRHRAAGHRIRRRRHEPGRSQRSGGARAVPRSARRLFRDPLQRHRAAVRRRVLDQRQDHRCAPVPACSTTASRSTIPRCSAATRRSSRRSASATASPTIPAPGARRTCPSR